MANDYVAHTEHAQWFGEPLDLDLERIGRSPPVEGHGVRFLAPSQPDDWGAARGIGPELTVKYSTQLDVDLFAIEGDGDVVGLVVLGTHYPEGLDGNSLLETTAIHRLWIAPRFQGKGWGDRALALALDYLDSFTDSARTYMGPVPAEMNDALTRRGFFKRGERWRAPPAAEYGGGSGES